MKTIVKITNDYDSDGAHQSKVDDINYIVNEISVLCETTNDSYINLIEQEKRYASEKEDYNNKIIIEARGYSQSDWQTYTLYYNEKELQTPEQRMLLSILIQHLERSFTHSNDYKVAIFEQTVIDGKTFNSDPHDYICFSITHIEFPDEADVLEEYNAQKEVDHDSHIITLD